jgi:hypothetical protein
MRRTLGTLMLTLTLASATLAGCGSDDGGVGHGEDLAGGPSTESATSSGSVDFTEVALVAQTAAGGSVSERATVLDDAAALRTFSDQFRAPGMADRLEAAVAKADVPSGQTLLGAVVAIGCDVPPGVTVQHADGGLAITALKVEKPREECFAPVTTVALVAVDADEV